MVDRFNVLQQQNFKVYYENQVVGDYFADIIAEYYFFNPKTQNPACSSIHFMVETNVVAIYY
jgi:hypothetical protein